MARAPLALSMPDSARYRHAGRRTRHAQHGQWCRVLDPVVKTRSGARIPFVGDEGVHTPGGLENGVKITHFLVI